MFGRSPQIRRPGALATCSFFLAQLPPDWNLPARLTDSAAKPPDRGRDRAGPRIKSSPAPSNATDAGSLRGLDDQFLQTYLTARPVPLKARPVSWPSRADAEAVRRINALDARRTCAATAISG